MLQASFHLYCSPTCPHTAHWRWRFGRRKAWNGSSHLSIHKGQQWSNTDLSRIFQHRIYHVGRNGSAICTNHADIFGTYLSMHCHHNYGKENKIPKTNMTFNKLTSKHKLATYIIRSLPRKAIFIFPPKHVFAWLRSFINQSKSQTRQSRGA